MIHHDLIAFALESVISAQLALFAAFLLSTPRRRAPALYFLAGLAICLACVTAANLLIGSAGWTWLSDPVLFLDLLVPPLIYLYVVQMRRLPRPVARTDLLHAAPAIVGLVVWKTNLVATMDVYVATCWFGYLLAAGYVFFRRYDDYAPAARQHFLTALLAVLAAIWLLRLAIVFAPGDPAAYRGGLPYLLILAAALVATCLILFTALRRPELLSVPGSYVKYGASGADGGALDALEYAMNALLDERRPYLDPDFSLAVLARLLDAPARSVSQMINARHGMNFSAYMNARRARTACDLLASAPRTPIKVVMFESGFRSKSIFNREFQRHVGQSPSEFRDRQREA
jgi:AraC-like DNA-binding protein